MITQVKVPLERVYTCRTCGGELLEFFNLGYVPLAGAFLPMNVDMEEKLYPLELGLCCKCTLVQTMFETTNDMFFGPNYSYLSSVHLKPHFEGYARWLSPLVGDGYVVEFGSNDGVLLSELQKLRIRGVGVDASLNVVEVARSRGVNCAHGYFNADVAKNIRDYMGPARVVTGSNVFAHNESVVPILEGASILLDSDGYFIVEVHYLGDLLAGKQFDFFYHEHIRYYSLRSIKALLEQAGFSVVDVVKTPLHSGSIRVISQKGTCPASAAVESLLAEESVRKMDNYQIYIDFEHEVNSTLEKTRQELKGRKHVIGYGASGRSVTLLHKLGVELDYMVDDSPLRYDKLLPGKHFPIFKTDREFLERADSILITAWPYAEMIMQKESWFPRDFIIPFPDFRVVRS